MQRVFYGSPLVLLCLMDSAVAGPSTYEITITAGGHDRNDAPVRVSIPSAALSAKAAAAILTGPDGKTIPAQWTGPGFHTSKDTGGEIHFLLPQLKAGESLRLKATLTSAAPAPDETYMWHDRTGDFTELRFGARPVLRYHYRAYDDSSKEKRDLTYKVFHHLFSPKGDVLTTNGLPNDPAIHSPHHRGIMYAFNRIGYDGNKMADTWHCTNGAHQSHVRFLASEAGPVVGRHRMVIDWHGADKAFAQEERELTAYNVGGGQLIEFASLLRPTSGAVKIDGDPQHAGFQFRADNEVFAKTSDQTIYVRPDGVGKPGETRNWDPATRKGPVNLPWNAMSFVLKDKRYTVAYLDHPWNPKEARHSEREYGRFGSYFEYRLTAEQPLRVNYRLWLQDGLIKPDDVAALSTAFVEPVSFTVVAAK